MSMTSDQVERHRKVTRELTAIYTGKNADYGDSFHATYLEEGMAAARVRLGDKLARFRTLTKGREANVKDETIRDTLLDLANYAIMTAMELDREAEARKARHEPDEAEDVLSGPERSIAAKLNAKYVTRSNIEGSPVEFWKSKPLKQGRFYCASSPDNRCLVAISTDVMHTRLGLNDCICVDTERNEKIESE